MNESATGGTGISHSKTGFASGRPGWRWSVAAEAACTSSTGGRVASAAALLALLAWSAHAHMALDGLAMTADPEVPLATASRAPSPLVTGTATPATRLGGYLGTTHTYPSEVRITNPPGTDITVSGFSWLGRPFKSPIYYGLRADRVPGGTGPGVLLDFTHAKAIAAAGDTARFSGRRNGRDVAPRATIGEVFKHLEFSHGHNIVTLNGVWRLPALAGGIRPYGGIGGGVSLPHTEIGFRDENARTYEYQFAGLAGQLLAGFEIPLGRVSVFAEWKFTYAPYSVPLSHEPYGWLLVTDLWRQLRAWLTGERPPGGELRTLLMTHHAIGGAMVRITPAASRN